jgi:hypothetical protein
MVQLTGFHLHNPPDPNEFAANGGEAYLRNTFLRNLKFGTVDLPPTLEEQQAGIQTKPVTMSELGISFPTLLYVANPVDTLIPNPDLFPLPPGVTVTPLGGGSGMSSSPQTIRGGGMNQPTGMSGAFEQYAAQRRMPAYITVRRFDFVIQFAWEVTPPSVRKQNAENDETTTDETATAGTTN